MTQDLSKSFASREEKFEDRWTSYGKHTGITKIYRRLTARELKKIEIFRDYDDKFLESISPDVSVAVWDKQKVLFEEGSYIDLAFFILKGNVDVYIQKQQKNGSHNNGNPEYTVFDARVRQIKADKEVVFLSSMDMDLPWGDVLHLRPGDFLGETGASIGWPQSVTAKTATECMLVQIRLPALQKMKQKSGALKERLDLIYIERSLSAQLKCTPLFRRCSDSFIEQFKTKVELLSFRRNDIITREGQPADAVYLVRAGFVKLSQKLGDGEIVVNYLSKGMLLGEIEFLMEEADWLHTASSVESTELVKIAHGDFQDFGKAYPGMQKHLWRSSARRLKESGQSKKNIGRSEFINTALDTGLVEGNSVLVIDLDLCTRCDDCVRGCADTHDGMPRFVREGEKYNNFLITRSCYHCQDPVCLIGCPTGAIRRAGVGDVVEIDAELCIGCRACFHKCPYDAITMVETANSNGHHAIPRRTSEEITELATKCDLCYDTGHSPACVDHCPQGCAIRVPNIDKFAMLISKSESRKTWRTFRLGRVVQSPTWLLSFLIATVACSGVYLLNQLISEVAAGNVWGLSYGAAATVLMTGAAFYGIRRRKMKFASKYSLASSKTWLQFHIYGGTLFLLLVFMHTGFKLPTGVLYWWLWILSIWVTVSGLFGIFLQKWVPQLLSSGLSLEVVYERIPELITELKTNADDLAMSCSEPVRNFYRKRISRALHSPKARFIYYVDITGGIHNQMKQFDFLKTILSGEDRQKLNELERLYKSKLEIDAHYTLQKALRYWLYTHLPTSLALLILVAIHLFAVFWY